MAGFRQSRIEGKSATEYIWEYRTCGSTHSKISVFLLEEVLGEWARRHGRDLSTTERFGLAKMALKSRFDEWKVDGGSSPVVPGINEIEGIAAILDL